MAILAQQLRLKESGPRQQFQLLDADERTVLKLRRV